MAEKRKGLMSQIADYQREERQKRTYATKAKPKLSAKAAKAKVDTKKAYSYNKRLDQSLGARNGKKSQSMKDRRDESKGAEKAAGRPAYSGNKSSTQGTSSTPSKSGTYGKSLPSNPKLKNVTMAPRKKAPLVLVVLVQLQLKQLTAQVPSLRTSIRRPSVKSIVVVVGSDSLCLLLRLQRKSLSSREPILKQEASQRN